MKTKNLSSVSVVGQKKGFLKNLYDYRHAYILLVPALIAVFFFLYLPLLGIILAFKDYNIYDGIWGSAWVGLDNFVTIFQQKAMVKAILNTIILSFILIFGTFPFPVILAVLFNEIRNARFKKIVQTVSYMPHFLSWVTVVGLCYAFLATEGPLNTMMQQLLGDGYVAKNFLMESKYFRPIAYIAFLWKDIGWSSVIYLAAITGIDESLYEAARIDGAGKFKQIWHITLPSIRNTMIILLVMKLGHVFTANFEMVYGLQNVFTIDDTEIISTLIYRTGIQNGNYSVATAFGLMQGVITIALILTTNFISKKLAEVSIW